MTDEAARLAPLGFYFLNAGCIVDGIEVRIASYPLALPGCPTASEVEEWNQFPAIRDWLAYQTLAILVARKLNRHAIDYIAVYPTCVIVVNKDRGSLPLLISRKDILLLADTFSNKKDA